MAKRITVHRLKNAPKGEPYAVEVQSCKTMGDAHKVVAAWWGSRGSVAMVVMEGKREDSRYTRTWADADRIPDDWIKQKAPRVSPLLPVVPSTTPAKAVAEAPTLYTEEETDQPAKPTGNVCPCCMKATPEGGYPDDREKNPSGRLANHRCMLCGSTQFGTPSRARYMQYMKYQSAVSKAHRSKPSPWNRGKGSKKTEPV